MTDTMGVHVTRKRVVDVGILFAILIFSTTMNSQGAIVERLKNGESLSIATIGTSLTDENFNPQNWFAQTGAWLSDEYPGQVTLSNRAVSATASVDLPQFNRPHGGTWQMEEVLANDNPDVIFIEFAINDAYKQFDISPSQSAANLQALIDRSQEWATNRGKTVEIIVQTMNNTGPSYAPLENDVGPYYQAWRDQAAANDALLIDHYPNWMDLYNSQPDHATWKSYIPDDIHPNTAGTTQVILPEIQRVLNGQVAPPNVGFVDTVVTDLVIVSNAGNIGEACGGAVGPARISGAVDYEYRIGKYEVTAGQYTEFLNAVAAVDTHELYNAEMANDVKGCQIQQSGTEGSFTYSVAPEYADRPVNYVSYWDACRFANWLHNDEPTGQQGAGTTESGAYTITTDGMADNSIVRNGGAIWAVTSEDEWYKAAYHKNDGVTANYWDYPTESDTPPGSDMADTSGNNGNYKDGVAPYPIDSDKYTTVTGEFENSPGPYGTFDQGGNVWEWTESIMPLWNDPWDLAYRELAGGTFEYDSSYAQAAYRIYDDPNNGSATVGFRVSCSIVNEPLPGDANGDGQVDVSDLGVLATHYGNIGGAEWGDGDFTGDGNVDVSDLGILATNYGSVAAQAVPEPSAFMVIASMLLAVAAYRTQKSE